MIILPRAIFDNALFLDSLSPPQQVPTTFVLDYRWATQFLLSYQHNAETFKSFRRELERLVQWSWLVANRSILSLKRDDIEQYLAFCQKPPIAWIGTKKTSRFIDDADKRVPNPNWRLFVMTTSKALKKQNTTLNRKQYFLSEKGFREIFTILNCFYNFLIQEDVTEVNPVAQIRQKNRFYRTTQGIIKIRRLSKVQWQAVMQAALSLAEQNPAQHERTLFIISILYSLNNVRSC